MRAPTEATVISADSYGEDNLIVATEAGEISLTKEGAAVLHTKSDAKVSGIVTVAPEVSFVFSERSNGRGSATAYEGPEPQQISGLTLHEVYGGSVVDPKHQTIAVFTLAAIRVLKFDIMGNPKAKILRTIELKGIKACCASKASSHALLVATENEYLLVDTNTGSRSPLFPIINGIQPMMTRMGEDFLVVQGTSSEEPAMGLFVDTKGEVARQGSIIQWPAYPTSLAASSNLLFSVSGGELKVHRFKESSATIVEEAVNGNFEPNQVKSVFKLSYPVKFQSQELIERLGDPLISFSESRIAFLLIDDTIELWKPTTRLVTLETRISNGELSTVEPDARYSNSEQGIAELKYLSLFLILHFLRENNVTEALREWRTGVQLDIELVLYIFNFRDVAPKNIFPGLLHIVSSLKEKPERQDGPNKKFLESALKTAIKRLRRDTSKLQLIKELEIILAKQLYETDHNGREFTRFLLEKDLKARKEILQWLEDTKQYDELEHYYGLAGKVESLGKLRLSILRDPASTDSEVLKAARNLVETAKMDKLENSQGFDMWDVVIEIIRNDRVDTQIGIQLLTSPQFESKYEPSDILQALKDQTNAGEPWRTYLKYLVYSKGLFKDDLVTLVVTDIIEHGQEKVNRAAIRTSYDNFARLDWPKSKYQGWLPKSVNINKSLEYPADLLRLQLELWELMGSDLDWVQLMSTFESHLEDFKIERAMIYQKLGLHEQSLQLLSDISDFRYVIDYATVAKDEDTKKDLAYLTLLVLLRYKGDIEILREFLNKSASYLEIDTVLRQVDNSTPFYVIADFVASKVKHSQNEKHRAHMLYAVAKASSPSIPYEE